MILSEKVHLYTQTDLPVRTEVGSWYLKRNRAVNLSSHFACHVVRLAHKFIRTHHILFQFDKTLTKEFFTGGQYSRTKNTTLITAGTQNRQKTTRKIVTSSYIITSQPCIPWLTWQHWCSHKRVRGQVPYSGRDRSWDLCKTMEKFGGTVDSMEW